MRGLDWKALLYHPVSLVVCRILFGGVFIVAAFGKISVLGGDSVKFLGSVYEYHLLPDSILPFFAVGHPGIELTSGILLLVGNKVRVNAMLLSALMLVFIIALMSAIFRGMELDCSCFDMLNNLTNVFGDGNDPNAITLVGWDTVFRDLVLLLPGLPLLFYPAGLNLLARSTAAES
jgi:uncharacterized membrane protein YphA (DoxX/SURF4 family)